MDLFAKLGSEWSELIMVVVNSSSLVDERDLLARIAGRDELAFKRVYDLYSNGIYKYALHLLGAEEVAEDCVQETFLKFWNMGEGLLSIQSLESYLVTICRNRYLDVLRKMKLTVSSEADVRSRWVEGHNDIEERIILDDTRKVLERGIGLLPAQQRLVYQLCHLEGLKYEEAAERLNISTNAVKLYMKLSLRFLRDYLSKHTDVAVMLVILKLF